MKLNARQRKLFNECQCRFLSERTNGYRDPSGAYHAPVSAREAMRQWRVHKVKIEKAVFDPDVIEKFQLDKDQPIPAHLRRYVGPKISEARPA